MTTQFVIGMAREAVEMTLLVSGPMLLAGLIVGLAVSIFQAVTQIQEMTLTFIPKILAVMAALLFFFPWIMEMLIAYTAKIIQTIPQCTG